MIARGQGTAWQEVAAHLRLPLRLLAVGIPCAVVGSSFVPVVTAIVVVAVAPVAGVVVVVDALEQPQAAVRLYQPERIRPRVHRILVLRQRGGAGRNHGWGGGGGSGRGEGGGGDGGRAHSGGQGKATQAGAPLIVEGSLAVGTYRKK